MTTTNTAADPKTEAKVDTTIRRSVPAKLLLPENLKDGYVFVRDRWEGEEYKVNAEAVARFFVRHRGLNAQVFENTDKQWRGGKHVEIPYYKVYFQRSHYEIPMYAWWAPLNSTWRDEVDLSLATWFEFGATT